MSLYCIVVAVVTREHDKKKKEDHNRLKSHVIHTGYRGGVGHLVYGGIYTNMLVSKWANTHDTKQGKRWKATEAGCRTPSFKKSRLRWADKASFDQKRIDKDGKQGGILRMGKKPLLYYTLSNMISRINSCFC